MTDRLRSRRPGRFEGADVLVLAKAWPPAGGGVERYSEEVARAYAECGLAVQVLTAGPVAAPGFLSIRGVRAERQATVALRCAAVLAAREVRRLAGRRSRPAPGSFVHATTWRMGVLAVALGLHRRRPLVVTVHGRECLGLHPVAARLRDLVLERAAVRVAVSPFTAQKLEAEIGLRFEVALNGTSIPGTCPGVGSRAGPVRVLTVCRLEPRKNIRSWLQAVERLRHHNELEVTIVGDGPERRSMQDLARTLGLDDIVDFPGRVADDELWRHYRRADLFVHPQVALEGGADVEGFGLTIADALAAGLPVVVGRAGGPGSVIPDSGAGLVVDGEDVGQIVVAVATLVADADLRRELGERAAVFARTNLTWKAHAAVVLDTLDVAGPGKELPCG